jgi:hypothetical protein
MAVDGACTGARQGRAEQGSTGHRRFACNEHLLYACSIQECRMVMRHSFAAFASAEGTQQSTNVCSICGACCACESRVLLREFYVATAKLAATA